MYSFSSVENITCHILGTISLAKPRPLTRYAKLQFAHAPGLSGTFSPPPTPTETASLRYRHASRHVRYARALMHVGIANPRWRGKRSQHSQRMCIPRFFIYDKRPIVQSLRRALILNDTQGKVDDIKAHLVWGIRPIGVYTVGYGMLLGEDQKQQISELFLKCRKKLMHKNALHIHRICLKGWKK